MVMIEISKCVVCGGCIDLCPSIALNMIDDVVTIDEKLCTECSICCLLLKPRASHGDAKGNYRHFRASFVSPVRVKQIPG